LKYTTCFRKNTNPLCLDITKLAGFFVLFCFRKQVMYTRIYVNILYFWIYKFWILRFSGSPLYIIINYKRGCCKPLFIVVLRQPL